MRFREGHNEHALCFASAIITNLSALGKLLNTKPQFPHPQKQGINNSSYCCRSPL